MSAHTPGQWVARPDPHAMGRDDYCIGLNDDCSPIDYVATCSKRDARLIAAAPELLEAMQNILNLSDSRLTRERKYIKIMGIAAAAIAKATGATP